jgi:hypothetical protein
VTSLLGKRNSELTPQQIAEKRLKHVYYGMISRCTKPTNAKFKDYGGRGIKVCDRWMGLTGFDNFIEDMGDRLDGASIDRIDNNGDYCPENCRWATREQQERNKRTTRYLTFEGHRKPLAEWAEFCGIPRKLLQYRVDHGWAIEKALTQPINRNLSRTAKKTQEESDRHSIRRSA